MFKTRNISYQEQFSPKTIIDANINFYDKAFRFEHRFSIILEKYDNAMLHMDYKVLIDQNILTSLLDQAPKEEKYDLMYFINLIENEVKEGTVKLDLNKDILHMLANGLTSKKNNIIFLSHFFKNFAYTRHSHFINLGKLLSEVLIKYNEGISAKAICASLRLKDNIYNEFMSGILNDNKGLAENLNKINALANQLKAGKDNNNIKEAIKTNNAFIFLLNTLVAATKNKYSSHIKNDKLLLNELTKQSESFLLSKCDSLYSYGKIYNDCRQMQYDFRLDQLLMLEHQMANDINVLSTTYPSSKVENAEEKNSVSKQQVLNTLEIINYKKPIQRIIRNTIFITKIIFTGLSICIFTGLSIFTGLCIFTRFTVRNS